MYGARRRNAEENLKSWTESAASFLFPTRCLLCEQTAVRAFFRGGVCEACWDAIPSPSSPRCESCDETVSTPDPGLCGRCLLDPPEFRSLRSAAVYRERARDLLLLFKFRGADFLAPHLARVMVGRLFGAEPFDEVTAVPARRLDRLRHDHAADLLAASIARELGFPFASNRVEKLRPTRRQRGLPLSERADNVARAFGARRGAPGRVLLIDDVATSGATARACARALRRAGADTVEVWCFARSTREDEIQASEQMTES